MAVASDSVESLLHQHRARWPWIYWLILTGFVAILACLPLVHVDVTVSAPGMVRPSHEKVVLRVGVSGRIARVLVEDNDPVQSGQALLHFDTREIDERLDHLESQISRHTILHNDLVGMLRHISEASSAIDLAVAGSPQGNAHGFPLLKPGAGKSVKTPYLRAEVEQLYAQLARRHLAVNKASGLEKRYDTLAAKGLVTDQKHEDARLERLALEAEAVLILEQSATHWQAQLREEEDTLTALRSDRNRVHEERKSYVLRAPMDGVIVGFIGWSPDAYVQSGQIFGAISPQADLVVESYVAPQDIGLIQVGQRVRLQIDSFPYTQWGSLSGTVMEVGADLTAERSESTHAFKVSIRPEKTHLSLPNGAIGTLLRGMTVVARYQVSRRNLLQIIYEDTSVWLNPYRGATTGSSRPLSTAIPQWNEPK